MTVTKRLLLLVAITLIGMIGICAIGIIEMEKVRDSASYATVNSVPSYEVLDNSFQEFVNAMLYVYQNVLIADKTERVEQAKKFDALWLKMLETLRKYESLISDDNDKKLLEIERALLSEYDAQRKKIFEASSMDQNDEVKKLLQTSQVTANKINDAFQAHRQYNHTLADAGEKEARRLYRNATWIFVGITSFAIMVSLIVAFLITRTLLKQLGGEPEYAAGIAGRIAAGDLAVAIDTKPNDQTSLLVAMKTMRDSLVNIVGQVRAGTDTIATASAQIASGNLNLSSRTEEQASALQETASSMEELTSTVKQNADNARQANQLAQSASEVAVKGGAVVSQVVGTMGSINESSKKIVDIIGVIDGIAFQTNILALNAAVEAARAGEQGRGFAVVATEVRNLAQRSAAAAKEIKTLIGDSVEKVDIGARLVDQAGITMDEVVASVKRVNDIIGEITTAGNEQTSGIEQINQAIMQMDGVTQQNAALVEQAAAAAQSMQEQSESLSQIVSVFKLTGGAAHNVAREPSSSRTISVPIAKKSCNASPVKKLGVVKAASLSVPRDPTNHR